MGILSGIFGLIDGMNESIEEGKQRDREEEINSYGLDDAEKELVRKGQYEPWNFEEDDSSDEDDYYHEDN